MRKSEEKPSPAGKPGGTVPKRPQTEASNQKRGIEELRRFAEQNPEAAVQMMRAWLKGGGGDG